MEITAGPAVLVEMLPAEQVAMNTFAGTSPSCLGEPSDFPTCHPAEAAGTSASSPCRPGEPSDLPSATPASSASRPGEPSASCPPQPSASHDVSIWKPYFN